MKARTLIILTTLVAATQAATAAAQRAPLDEALLARTAERELTRFAAAGAAIAVVTRDSTLLLRGIGRTRHDAGEAVTADLPFGTVALRDVFTGLAAVRLAQQGRVDLDAPVGAYVTDLPPRLGAVTLTQLLSHTAGLDDARPQPVRRPTSIVWAEATDRALFTEPGAIHSRSRHGVPLARGVLEVRAGSPDSALVRSLVLEPAGMTRTTADARRAEALGAVTGVVMSTSGDRPLVGLRPTANAYPHLYATARDLAALLRRLLGGSDGERPGSLRAAFDIVARSRAPVPTAPADSVGLGGVRISRMRGHRTVSVAAGEAGYGLVLHILPEPGVALVVVANATGAVLSATADVLLDAFVGATATDTTPAAPPPSVPAAPAAYAGTYVNGDRFIVLEAAADGLVWRDGDLALRVERDGTRLRAMIGDGRVAQAFYWTRDAAGRTYLVVAGVAFRRDDRPVR